MLPKAQEVYFSSLIKIVNDNNIAVGTGVLVAEDTILTCAHVIANALGYYDEATCSELDKTSPIFVHRVFVDGALGVESDLVECYIEQYYSRGISSEQQDLAVLKTKKSGRYPVDGKSKISNFSNEVLNGTETLSVFGFPEDAEDKITQTVEAKYSFSAYMPNQWLKVLANKSYGEEVRAGFSGAPIMNLKNGNVIGIVCEADDERRTAYIIPISIIQKIIALPISSIEETEAKPINSNILLPIQLSEKNSIFRILLDLFFPKLHYFLTVKLRVLSDPSERPLLEKHLREQHAKWVDKLEEKTFLPPPAKEVPSSPPQMLKHKKLFYTPIQQLIKEVVGVSSGGDAASAQISALSKRSKRVRSLVKRLKHTEMPLIVLGDPGSGKTITLKQVAIELSLLNSRKVFPSLCVFVSLGSWKPVDKPIIRDVEAFVSRTVGEELAPILHELAKRERLIIIFDGLDEMSRLNYNEHTEALSHYAERYKGQIKTLFSCRIADFSPKFRHTRLVLLPFTRSHIISYLIRQFDKGKLELVEESISAKELGKRLSSKKLPIQPQNPFSLWLLSLYIREKQYIPDTRTELLSFFFEHQYERKLSNFKVDNENLPSREQLFLDWGQLALLISKRNLGTDIGIHEVRAVFGHRTDMIVEAGRICGVLQQTLDYDPPLLRFDHHRAQEYFTAHGIVQSNQDVNWAELLKIPRWQETLVNVAQMDAKSTPLSILTKNLNSMKIDENLKAIDKAFKESEYAEQVELSTRVLIAIPKSEESTGLEKEIVSSSNWLAEYGNPTSKVKMLRLINRLPDECARDVVEKTLDSKVLWVRNQALEVAASISNSISASPLPLEIASSYGDGSIVRTIGSKLKIAYKVKSIGLALVTILSFLLFLLHIVVVSVIVEDTAIDISSYDIAYSDTFYKHKYFIEKQLEDGEVSEQEALVKQKELEEVQVLYEESDSFSILLAIILAIIGSLIWLPKYFWIIIPVSVTVIVLLISVIYTLWLYIPIAILHEMIVILFTSIFMFIALVGVISFFWLIVAGVISLIFNTILAIIISIWSKKTSHFFSTYRAVFNNNGFPEYIAIFVGTWVFILGLFLLGLGIQIVKWLYNWLLYSDHWWDNITLLIDETVPNIDFLNRFFDYILFILLIVGTISLTWTLISVIFHNKRENKKLSEYFEVPITTFGFSLVILLLGKFIFVGNESIDEKASVKESIAPISISWIMEYIVIILTVIVGMIIVSILIYMIYKIWRKYSPNISFGARYIDTQKLERVIMSKDIDEQSRILKDLSFDVLNSSPNDLYSLLIKLEPYVTEEPALSRYWQKRIELEEILRQEREG